MARSKRFGFLKRWAITSGIALIKSEIGKIKYLPLLEFIQGKLKLLEDIGEALTDKNPDDKGQLKEILNQYKEELVDTSLETAAQIIEKEMKNQAQAAIIAAMIRAVAEEQAFSDGEEDEGELVIVT